MVLALWGGKLVHAATYGVSARDPLAMSVAALALIVAALGATVGPARRAAQADPARVLRAE